MTTIFRGLSTDIGSVGETLGVVQDRRELSMSVRHCLCTLVNLWEIWRTKEMHRDAKMSRWASSRRCELWDVVMGVRTSPGHQFHERGSGTTTCPYAPR